MTLEECVMYCYETHKNVFEVWEDGEPIKAYYDNEGLKVIYSSGKSWHYGTDNEEKFIWW